MRRTNHLTPGYIISRGLTMLDEYRNPDNPWLTKDSVALLDSLLRKTDIGIEFGSGRSTKWFLQRMASLISVEENEEWYRKVEGDTRADIASGRLRYILARQEQEYVDLIDGIDDASLDFCLVDSLYRDLCALHSVPKMKAGGLLVVDNINLFIPCDESKSPDSRTSHDGAASDLWECFLQETRSWRYIWTTNGVSDTGIWIKSD